MSTEKNTRQNRVREALGRIYDHQPPYFREYLRRFKEDPTSRVFAPLAEAYRRMGRLDEAIAICREGLEHHPDFFGGRVALAKCYIDKKWWDDARQELERVVASVPENLLAQRLLADVFLALQDKVGALHCYKMALLLSPSDVVLSEKVRALERGGAASLAELEQARALEADEELSFEPDAGVETLLEAAPVQAPLVPEPLWENPSKVGPGRDPIETEMERMLEVSRQSQREEDEEVSEHQSQIDSLLGILEVEPDESFKVESVGAIFSDGSLRLEREITTSTLGDLYFSQGQYDKALRIFEKLAMSRPTPELARKLNSCRARLGVDRHAMVRSRQIQTLRSVLHRVRTQGV